MPPPSPTANGRVYLSLSFKDNCDALAAAYARGGETVATAATLQFVERGQNQARARSAERVAERDCAAVDVRLRAVEPEFLLDREVLARERLVDFDEVYVFELQVRLLKRLAYRGHGADAHDFGLDARVRPRDDAARGRQVLLTHVVLARDDERRRAVHDAGGVARRDETVLAKRRGELRENFERRLGA